MPSGSVSDGLLRLTSTVRQARDGGAESSLPSSRSSILGLVLGAVLVVVGAPLGFIFGGYLIGIGINYLALLIASWQLLRSSNLRSELSDLDVNAEMRRYSIRQARILIPFLLAFYIFSTESRR